MALGIFSKLTKYKNIDLKNPFQLSFGKGIISFPEAFTFSQIKMDIRECLTRISWKSENEEKILSSWNDTFAEEKIPGLITLLATAICDGKTFAAKYENGFLIPLTDSEIELRKNKNIPNSSVADFGDNLDVDFYKFAGLRLWQIERVAHTHLNIAAAFGVKFEKAREILKNSDNIAEEMIGVVSRIKSGGVYALSGGDTIGGIDGTLHSDILQQESDRALMNLSAQIGKPYSLISKQLTSGMSVTGDADEKEINKYYQNFFWTFLRKILIDLYGIFPILQSSDWRSQESDLRSAVILESLESLTDAEKRTAIKSIIKIGDNIQDSVNN